MLFYEDLFLFAGALRLSWWDMLEILKKKDKGICPLFSAPCINLNTFTVDWLRAVDLGVAADFLGNVFKQCLQKIPGPNKRARIAFLFNLMKNYYKSNRVQNRLGNLTEGMIQAQNKPPKLRASAAETRGLIDFAVELTATYMSDADHKEETIKNAALLLQSCYRCLSVTGYDTELLARSCQQFCLLYIALETTSDNGLDWRVKPKLHLFQEVCEFAANRPARNWTYRDEDAGGGLSRMSRRKGGHNAPATQGINVLLKFATCHIFNCFHILFCHIDVCVISILPMAGCQTQNASHSLNILRAQPWR